MGDKVNEVLKGIVQEFSEERSGLKAKLQNNLIRVKELDVFLNSLESKESDFNVFSPRKSNTFSDKKSHADKMEENKKEKKDIEIENQDINKKIIKLEKRISDLQKLISDKRPNDNLMSLDIQEKERQRIARDLHDFSLQNLTHLIHVLELSSLFIDQDPDRAKLEIATAGKKIKSIIEDIRNTIYDLRPMEFDDLGFKDSLLSMVDKLKYETDIFIDLDMEADIPIKNDLIFSNIYRIIKECVTNSIKHSEAKEIKITIFEDNSKCDDNEVCHIEIKDNGKGFDNNSAKEKKRHFGLQILEERIQLLKGIINIQSDKNGTIINIDIPIDDNELGGSNEY